MTNTLHQRVRVSSALSIRAPLLASETVETTMMASTEKMGFVNVFDEQKDTVPLFVCCKDVLVLLPSGKGKSVLYFLGRSTV